MILTFNQGLDLEIKTLVGSQEQGLDSTSTSLFFNQGH